MYIQMHTCTHKSTQVPKCTLKYNHVHTQVHTPAHKYIQIHTWTHKYRHIYTQVHIQEHAITHTSTHEYIHEYTPKNVKLKLHMLCWTTDAPVQTSYKRPQTHSPVSVDLPSLTSAVASERTLSLHSFWWSLGRNETPGAWPAIQVQEIDRFRSEWDARRMTCNQQYTCVQEIDTFSWGEAWSIIWMQKRVGGSCVLHWLRPQPPVDRCIWC